MAINPLFLSQEFPASKRPAQLQSAAPAKEDLAPVQFYKVTVYTHLLFLLSLVPKTRIISLLTNDFRNCMNDLYHINVSINTSSPTLLMDRINFLMGRLILLNDLFRSKRFEISKTLKIEQHTDRCNLRYSNPLDKENADYLPALNELLRIVNRTLESLPKAFKVASRLFDQIAFRLVTKP